MWWKKDIEDRSALKIIRVAVALMYLYIALSLSITSSDGSVSLEPVKVISNFCLLLAFITLIPSLESVFKKDNLRFMNDISIVTSFFVIIILHVYMFSSLGIQENIKYIFISLLCNSAAQLPLIILTKRSFKDEVQ
jgi:hypothetical protein